MKIDEKTKELIAIGASVSTHCQPCLEYHVAKAREAGVCDDFIADAISVGRMVGKGASAKMDKFSVALMKGEGTCGSTDDECSGI